MSPARPAVKWILRGLAALVVVVLIAGAGGAIWLRGKLRASIPIWEGTLEIKGLSAPVRVDLDALGVPTISGESRLDVARATGFLHAQNRFFQMDLLRRQAAGELSELLGPATLESDRAARLHRFRDVARRDMATSSPEERALMEAYAGGVNAGLGWQQGPPFEYLLLQAEPRAWLAEDSVLANLSMFMVLHGPGKDRESGLGLMHDLLPEPLFAFLTPQGTPWDAPIVGGPLAQPPLPGPDVFDLRHAQAASLRADWGPPAELGADEPAVGSNNWAVAGALTAHGGALLANDMHLPIGVPNTWYRVSLSYPAGGQPIRVTGVTLPGTPVVVAGSNGRLAWGFTNTEADWVDLVLLEPVPGDAEAYVTPAGPRALEHHDEAIAVKGAAAEHLDVATTIWGPVVDTDHTGRKRALRWTAHDTEAINAGLIGIESASTLEEAQRAGNLSGIPPQNLMVATADGRIGWSIAGRIPRRVGFDGRLPSSWADGTRRWDGYLAPEEYPRVNDPSAGRLWTANARVVDGAMLRLLGDGGYDFGARAAQIRDDLMQLTRASEKEMLAIQLDDRAHYLKLYRDLLLAALTPEAIAGNQRRADLKGFVESWGDRAAIDSVGYRMVRAFAGTLARFVYEPLTASCKKADSKFQFFSAGQYQGVVAALLEQRPAHLLDPQYASWDALILAAADTALNLVMADGRPMEAYTWGDRNTSRVQHPISLGVPMLSRWLDMPPRPLPGDNWMPRVQGISFGASQRFAVSPGHEEEGYFHMPCGQSGHPLSPHYGDGHDAWAEGRMTSFLPGPAASALTLVPGS